MVAKSYQHFWELVGITRMPSFGRFLPRLGPPATLAALFMSVCASGRKRPRSCPEARSRALAPLRGRARCLFRLERGQHPPSGIVRCRPFAVNRAVTQESRVDFDANQDEKHEVNRGRN